MGKIVERTSPADNPGPLAHATRTVNGLAAGRTSALEIFNDRVDHGALDKALSRAARAGTTNPRLAIAFWSMNEAECAERAARFASEIDVPTVRVGGLVLVERLVRKQRLAILAHRRGAKADSLDGDPVLVRFDLRRQPSPATKGRRAPAAVPVELVVGDLRARLRTALAAEHFTIDVSFRQACPRARTSIRAEPHFRVSPRLRMRSRR